jgi:hypothetical protein
LAERPQVDLFEYPVIDTLGAWILAPHWDWEWFYSPLDGGALYRHAFSVWHKYISTN